MNKILIFLIIISFTACVPYKNIVYVQGNIKDNTNLSEEYKVKKKDILYIEIKSSNEEIQKLFQAGTLTQNGQVSQNNLYFKGYTVDENGTIELPILSKIKVEGKTFEEIKNLIKKRLLQTQFASLQDVFVVVKLGGVPYTILGEVKNPQSAVLYKTQPNILDAIASAGDVTLTGDLRHVVLIRDENGKKIKEEMDLTQSDIINSPYFYLRPNDLIYVKPLRQKTLGTGTTLSQTISTTITALSLITTIILLSNLNK